MPRRPRSRVPSTVAGITDAEKKAANPRAYYADLTKNHPRLTDLQMDPDRLPWEQQPYESAKQHAYFLQYLEMKPYARSLAQLGELIGKDRGYLSVLNRSHHWGERVLAWDTEQRRKYELRLEQRREELIEQHLRVSDGVLRMVLAKVGSMDPTRISERDMGPLMAAAGDLARKALGMDTPRGTNVAVMAAAGASATAKAESKAEGEAEARVQMEKILADMDRMVEAMTPEQRREAVDSWGALALPSAAAVIVDGEVVES